VRAVYKLLLSIGAVVALTGGAAAAVVFGGLMNVAVTEPDPAAVQWVLSTTMKNSVRRHASDLVVPDGIDLADRALAQRAFGHYSVACTPCHGGPGIDAAPWLVLDPPARPLADTAEAWSDAELFWIVKHGIQMTGMPALGPTHQDADLWAIAAFVRQLPDMTAQEYEGMAARHAMTKAEHR
jgi:mono/diheme cytochrome c family protein